MWLLRSLKLCVLGLVLMSTFCSSSINAIPLSEGPIKVDGLEIHMSRRQVEELMSSIKFLPLPVDDGSVAYCLEGKTYESVLGPVVQYDSDGNVSSVVGERLQLGGVVLTDKDELSVMLNSLEAEAPVAFSSGQYDYLTYPSKGVAVKFFTLDGGRYIYSFRLYGPDTSPEVRF